MEGIRKYQTDDLIVHWDAKLCTHASECWKNLPQVFKPSERPWVKIEQASPEEIIRTIDLCPTGALKYELTSNSRVDPAIARGPNSLLARGASAEAVEIKATPDGPLMVKGAVRIVDANGELIREGSRIALCSCGKSANKPFCDGSHLR